MVLDLVQKTVADYMHHTSDLMSMVSFTFTVWRHLILLAS